MALIGAANLKNRQGALSRLLEHQLEFAIVSEAGRLDKPLDQRDEGRWRVVQAEGPDLEKDDELAVLVRDRFPSEGEVVALASKPVPGHDKLAPARWVVSQRLLHPDLGKLAVFGFHPNAGMRHYSGSQHPVVRAYAESVGVLGRELRRALTDGYRVAGGGDLNMGDRRDDLPWSPFKLFEGLGIRSESEGVDALFASKGIRLTDIEVLARGEIGPDHPALIGELGRA